MEDIAGLTSRFLLRVKEEELGEDGMGDEGMGEESIWEESTGEEWVDIAGRWRKMLRR